MTLEMISYSNGEANLIFRYIREQGLEIDSVKLIESDSSTNIMLVYVWCTEAQKEVLIRLKKIDEDFGTNGL